jgi:hypothetical protein
MEILKSMTAISGLDDYRFLFSLRPVILLAAIMFVWMAVFVFVLVTMMDDSNKSKLIKNYTFTVVKYFGTCLKLRI